jgi:large-conductance mechanosensitive channel
MNWLLIIIISVVVLALVVFLVVRNIKDEKEFEEQINNDYHKTKEEEGDIDTEPNMK